MFSLCIRNAIARTLFSFAIDCCLQTFTFLVYYKDLFLYLDKIVLRLCLIFCLILQFLAKYLGNLNKLLLSKIIFAQRLSLLIFSCYHSNSACVPHQANLNNLQNTIVNITLCIFDIFGYCHEVTTFTESIELNLSLFWCLVKCPITQNQI